MKKLYICCFVLEEFLGEIWTDSHAASKEKQEKGLSRLVGGSFNKPGNDMRKDSAGGGEGDRGQDGWMT